MQTTLREVRKTLRSRFHMTKLRTGQEEIIRSVLAQKDTLAILPTGAGKSLCYQLPALHFSGVTIVISPLISLMKDQHEKMQDLDIASVEFNSTIAAEEQADNRQQIQRQEAELIYVTPERFVNPQFLKTLKGSKVDLVVIDEAHCVSQWGHDFRPAYLGLADVIKKLHHPVVLALTATATADVVEDIQAQLKLKDLQVFRAAPLRENLFLAAAVLEHEEDKRRRLLEVVQKSAGSGIVYVSTVRAVTELQRFLEQNGVAALVYHGKLKKAEREINQNEFIHHSPRWIVATNAFGMGIDKADVRTVIHYNFPGSLESYYQEAGRAGRDHLPSRCELLYLKKDRSLQALFIARKYPSFDDLTRVYRSLQKYNSRIDLAKDLPLFSKRKLSVIVSFLRQLEILRVKRDGTFTLNHRQLSDVDLSALADRYRQRASRDQDKLKHMIIYAQTALCRWKTVYEYLEGTAAEFKECGHCDNCLRA